MRLTLVSSLIIVVVAMTWPSSAFAQFVPFQTLPFLYGDITMETYINALYTLSIAIASVIAVVKLIIAGVKYMLSEIVTDKSDAKKDIQNALLGLLIILVAATILETINPSLRDIDVVGNGQKVIIAGPGEGRIADSVNFNPGDTWDSSEAANYCGNTFGVNDIDSDCLNSYIDTLTRSCKNNGGSDVSWKIDPNIDFKRNEGFAYSYYSYTCK